MSLSVSDFNCIFPEFKGLKDPFVDRYLILAKKVLDEEAWGDLYDDVVGLVAAHNIALANEASKAGTKGGIAGSHGPLISASAAGMASSFAPFQTDNKSLHQPYYSKTTYGQQFLALQRIAMPIAMLAI